MTKDEAPARSALKLALEGAANYIDALGGDSRKYRQALALVNFVDQEQPAQPQKEPVAWKLVPVEPTEDMWKAVNKLDDEMAAGSYDGKGCSIEQAWNCLLESAPATSPPAQRTWVGLTDEDIKEAEWLLSAIKEHEAYTLQEQLLVEGVDVFARAIEAKLKEKNK